jgi:hypothetical protein
MVNLGELPSVHRAFSALELLEIQVIS